MKFSELTVLLDCHSLEDFPSYHEGRQADELLAAWCAPWHPALIVSAGALPTWQRVDMPPEALAGRLLVIAPFMLDRLPAGFAARAKSEGAHLVHEANRDAAVSAALAGLDDSTATQVEPQLAADFLALGFCRLQVELLTRYMRYSPYLDETHFQNEAIAAACAAVEGRVEESREHLLACLSALHDARKHFYPAEVYLLDVMLLAETTLGAALQQELASATPKNLLAPLAVFEQLSREDPSRWSELLAAIDRATACVLGNEIQERDLPLLPIETVRASIAEGACAYELLLGRGPQVYARRRNGLSPVLPQILTKLGYQGALHFTLDDGRFPLGPQSKTRWEGLDSSIIDIFGRVPFDAAKPETFLGLPRQMADAMDHDHVATVAFAHWPLAASPWYADLRRIAELSPVLGKFMLCDDYFSHTDMPGRLSKFEPDEYRTPYLMQAIIKRESDPISRFVREHCRQAESAAAAAIETLAQLVSGKTTIDCTDRMPADVPPPPGLNDALAQVEFRTSPRTSSEQTTAALIVNPLSFTRRMGVVFPEWLQPPEAGSSVVASASLDNRSVAIVEVPAMGFVWVTPAESQPPASRGNPIARENVLGNEFFEATISRTSGGIQSLYSYAQRGNLMSQQVGFRLPDPNTTAWSSTAAEGTYAAMRTDSVEITASCSVFGEITSRGGLFEADGRQMARFRQVTQVWSTSRVIRVEIELEDIEEPRADPWNSYYAARFAWPDEAADLYRGVAGSRQKTSAARIEAPEYVDIDSGAGSLSILTLGLPYHRRAGSRMLDSLLVVRGETARRFSIGIGVELAHPAAAALELLTPSTALLQTASPPAASSGWFFHIDARNVVATHWKPIVDEDASATQDGSRPIRGFRARLLETAGRAGRVTVRAFRPVAAARQTDFRGQTLLDVRAEGDKISLDFAAHEWIEVEATWSR